MSVETIELLAPAKNIACGIAAINHGADAVYIGGPLFSARAAAANSLADIERLVRHAHQFRAKVYVALNTLFNDEELEQAVALSHQLYQLGADALIIQDVGLLESDLPPIPLHASTQMNNRTVDKVRFLEQVGFAQVVLARELSLPQIRTIRAGTTVPLECFVHGALCVSYSGQCFISEVVAGRSANRGRCAQFCRHRFDLRDRNGAILAHSRSLLSLKDLDLSAHLGTLIDAGIRSFKIEGRLKDENYVKNVTAAYRLALDAIIDSRDDLVRASSGRCRFDFIPDLTRSFSRGATDLFLHRPRRKVAEIRTPKSIGKKIGRVIEVDAHSFTLSGTEPVHNGDGLCFFNQHQELVGLRVNRVAGQRIYPKDGAGHLHLPVGADIYRNLDLQFNRLLERSTLCRSITVHMTVQECADGLRLRMVDEDSLESTTTLAAPKEKAAKVGMLAAVAHRQLKKDGGTIFAVDAVILDMAPDLFFPASVFNDLRRTAFANHLEMRLRSCVPETRHRVATTSPWPATEVHDLDNITNSKAAAFYLRHGAQGITPGRLHADKGEGRALMTTKYCLRAQLGLCARSGANGKTPAESLYLADKAGTYQVDFDCEQCEMVVRKKASFAGAGGRKRAPRRH